VKRGEYLSCGSRGRNGKDFNLSYQLLLVACLITFAAALVQGITGLGFALIVAPAIGLIDARLLPALPLLLMLPLNLFVVWREWRAIDITGASVMMAGRLAGTGGGIWLLSAISATSLGLLVGISTIIAAGASLLVPSFKPNGRALLAAGAITGVTETATGIGGPPMALIYQHRTADVLRSTIAICFLLGELISLAVLLVLGRIEDRQVRAALLLMPAVILGMLLSSALHQRVQGHMVRVLVLAFAMVSGIIITAKSW
jgi:uncharacterized membrane protein YfcA